MPTSNPHRLEGYLDRLFGFAVSLAGNREEARDLVQDCAVKALSAQRVPEDEPAYRAWLFRVLRNRFIDRLRQNRRRPEVAEFDNAAELQSRTTEPDQSWRGDQHLINRLTVKLAMRQLSGREREIIALIDIAGLTYGEAAAVLNIPVGTVMSRISRARHALLVTVNESSVRSLPEPASKGSAK